MNPHRRQLVLKALYEIRGLLAGVDLLHLSDDELLKIYMTIGDTFDEANSTEPGMKPKL